MTHDFVPCVHAQIIQVNLHVGGTSRPMRAGRGLLTASLGDLLTLCAKPAGRSSRST